MLALCTAWLIGISVCIGTPGSDTPVFTVEGVNPVWLESTQQRVLEQLEMLTSAYGLDQETRQALIDELQRRLEAEVGYQRSTNVELEALNKAAQAPDAGEAAMDALMAKLKDVIDNAPLNEDRVVAWLEERVPPEVLPESRKRLQELRFRRQRMSDVRQEDVLQRSKTRKMLARQARQYKARLTAQGHPIPTRLEIQDVAPPPTTGRIVRPGHGVTRRETCSAPLEDPTEQTLLKCAPIPLHEWDRFVQRALAEAGASSDQIDACQMLLAQFKRKAQQYVQDHAELFEIVALSPSLQAYETRLAALQRETPIHAYCAELKLRVAGVLNR